MVDYEVQGRVALITLNRPEARNAVNGDVADGMEAAIDQLEADDEVWVGVLAANTEGQERPVFCAGADLKAINSGEAGSLGTKRGGFAGFVYRERAQADHRRRRRPGHGRRVRDRPRLPTSSSPRPARRSAWPRSSATWSPAPAACSACPGPSARPRPWRPSSPASRIPAERAYAARAGQPPGRARAGRRAEAMALADQICATAPLAVWASREVVLAADYEDDDDAEEA